MFSSRNSLCCIKQLLLLLAECLRSARPQVSGDALGGKNTVRLACLVEHHRLLLPSSKVPEVSFESVPEAREAMQACKDRKEVAAALPTTSQLLCLDCDSLGLADLVRSGLRAPHA